MQCQELFAERGDDIRCYIRQIGPSAVIELFCEGADIAQPLAQGVPELTDQAANDV